MRVHGNEFSSHLPVRRVSTPQVWQFETFLFSKMFEQYVEWHWVNPNLHQTIPLTILNSQGKCEIYKIGPTYAAHNSEFIQIKATTVCRQDSSSSNRQLYTCHEIVAGCENLFPVCFPHIGIEHWKTTTTPLVWTTAWTWQNIRLIYIVHPPKCHFQLESYQGLIWKLLVS